MAKGSTGLKHRANTYEENTNYLRELTARNELDSRSPEEFNRLFVKLNAKNAEKLTKHMRTSVMSWHNKTGAERLYGPIPGFPPGSWWGIRMDCSRDRVHDPFSATIQEGPVGAISICISHSNEDVDVDNGDTLTFTGAEYGQKESQNDSLILSYQNQIPIRIVRGYSLSNKFAPKTGYRYDGLYMVVAHWLGTSTDSKEVHKFALKRISNQEPSPWKNRFSPTSRRSLPDISKRSEATPKSSKKILTRSVYSISESTMPEPKRGMCSVAEKRKINYEKDSAVSSSTENVCSITPAKIVSDDHRNVHESIIVSRRVSKKLGNSTDLTMESGSSVVSSNDSLVSNANASYDLTSKAASSKLQNTNISIRTDLYDSSHNLQQDTKKVASTFCRVFKPAAMCRRVDTYTDSESASSYSEKVDAYVRLDILRLPKKSNSIDQEKTSEREDSKQTALKVADSSTQNTVPKTLRTKESTQQTELVLRASSMECSGEITDVSDDEEFPSDAIASSTMTKQIPKRGNIHTDSNEEMLSVVNTNLNDVTTVQYNMKNTYRIEHSYAKPSYRQICDVIGALPENVSVERVKRIMLPSDRISERMSSPKRRSIESPTSSRNSQVSMDEASKNFESIESLTPDKILNLIVKEKYHPMAKLLIGSMIGVGTGETAILKAYDALISQNCKTANDSSSATDKTVSKTIQRLSERVINKKVAKNLNYHQEMSEFESSDLSVGQRTRRLTRHYKSDLDNSTRRILRRKIHDTLEINDKRSLTRKKNNTRLRIIRGTPFQSDTRGRFRAIRQNIDRTRHNVRERDSKAEVERDKRILRTELPGSVPNFEVIREDRLRESDRISQIRLRNIRSNEGTATSSRSQNILLTKTAPSVGGNKKRKPMRRKRRGEIANLVIDANISPKIRGPRTRRLRLISTRTRPNDKPVNAKSCTGRPNKVSVEQKRVMRSDPLSRSKRTNGGNTNTRRMQHRNMERKRLIDRKLKKVRRTRVEQSKSQSTRNMEMGRLLRSRRDTRSSQNSIRKESSVRQTTKSPDRSNEKSTKPKMVNATTQCSLLCHPTMDFSLQVDTTTVVDEPDSQNVQEGQETVKIEIIDLEEVKSETYEEDATYDEDTHYTDDRVCALDVAQTSYPGISSQIGSTAPAVSHQLNPDCQSPESAEVISNQAGISEKLLQHICDRPSAFVAVNSEDVSMKIARLKSIGFRPINTSLSPVSDRYTNTSSNYHPTDSPQLASNSAVAKRAVNEEYEKYTSEENNVVGYMDEELCYQDIEDEDDCRALKRALIEEVTTTKMETVEVPVKRVKESSDESEFEESTRWESRSKNTRLRKRKGKSDVLPSEEDPDAPWHGWRKIISNEQTQWVGW
ncbi:uncharacterized protein LOC107270814 [Cephus cinctus]|uniref:Uncharacterized protein LOC107270814 n=1 Tax=Cephus cinctus TaxID=211228 RepID=A0AAJ7FPA2_CEPCN|nr:uncharacterized protein LOC107270814 [Cephus cinctus]